MAIDPNASPAAIRRAGMAALVEQLGVAGALAFIRQLDSGAGDYTADRHAWVDDVSVDDVLALARKRAPSDPTETNGTQ